MTPRGLAILAGVTGLAVLGAVAAEALQPRLQAAVAVDRPLLPDLAAQSALLSRIDMTSAGSTVTLLRDGAGGWHLGDLAGFPAEKAKVAQLVGELADLRLVETRTDNAQRLARLGLTPPGEAGSAATEIKLTTAQGAVQGDVVLGKRPSAAPGSADSGSAPAGLPGGLYVRYAPETQAYLAAGSVTLRPAAEDWYDAGLVDVAEGDVLRVDYAPPGAKPFALLRPDPTQMDFDVEGIPADRQTVGAVARSSATLLNALTMTVPVRADTLDWSKPFRTAVTIKGGHKLTVESVRPRDTEPAWFRFTVALGPAGEPGKPDPTRSALEALAKKADGWAFHLPDYRAAPLRRNWDDVTEPKTAG